MRSSAPARTQTRASLPLLVRVALSPAVDHGLLGATAGGIDVLALHADHLGDGLAAGTPGAWDTIPGVGPDMYLMSSPR